MYVWWAIGLFAIARYGLASDVPELVLFSFVVGVGFAYGTAIWGTMMHRLVPRELLGRVTSVDWMMSMALIPVWSAAVGFIAEAAGAQATLVAAGLISGTVTVVTLFVVRGLRDSERDGSMISGARGRAGPRDRRAPRLNSPGLNTPRDARSADARAAGDPRLPTPLGGHDG